MSVFRLNLHAGPGAVVAVPHPSTLHMTHMEVQHVSKPCLGAVTQLVTATRPTCHAGDTNADNATNQFIRRPVGHTPAPPRLPLTHRSRSNRNRRRWCGYMSRVLRTAAEPHWRSPSCSNCGCTGRPSTLFDSPNGTTRCSRIRSRSHLACPRHQVRYCSRSH